MRRVALTGLGLLTPLGNSPTDFMRGALNGINCVREVTKFDATGYPVRFGAEIRFDESDLQAMASIKTEMPTVAKWCVHASRMAIKDADLDVTKAGPHSTAVVLGVSAGATEHLSNQLLRPGVSFSCIRGATAVLMSPAAAAVHVSRELGIHGEILNITSACSSSTSAIAHATRMIQYGAARCVLTGGAEESISPMYLGAFGNSTALSKRNGDPAHASRPYDRERDGYVLSDAACIMVLEDLEYAQKRGAQIYCEMAGVGGASDAASPYEVSTNPNHGAWAVENALYQARANRDEVDVYSALGISVPCMDVRETRMLKSIFGDHARKLWISSIKSMLGHPLGAAGAVQTVMAALAIKNNAVPPTINYAVPDPDCDLDYCPNHARERRIRNALVYTLGNSANVALVMKSLN